MKQEITALNDISRYIQDCIAQDYAPDKEHLSKLSSLIAQIANNLQKIETTPKMPEYGVSNPQEKEIYIKPSALSTPKEFFTNRSFKDKWNDLAPAIKATILLGIAIIIYGLYKFYQGNI